MSDAPTSIDPRLLVGTAPTESARVPVAPLAVLACGLLVLGVGPGTGAFAAHGPAAPTRTTVSSSAGPEATTAAHHAHHAVIASTVADDVRVSAADLPALP